MERSQYNFAIEYEGGFKSRGDGQYTFSDGVGCMSRRFAREISKDLGLGEFVPSCIQSRFRGFKGIHAINPNMDFLSQWARQRGISEEGVHVAERILHVDLVYQ